MFSVFSVVNILDAPDKPGHDDLVCVVYPHVMPRFMRGNHLSQNGTMKGGWVYIMTNKRHGTLYVGVTSDIRQRAWQHREGVADGFTKRYALKRLVYVERHDDIREAIRRERRLKHWPRQWKINTIEEDNPEWRDLYRSLS